MNLLLMAITHALTAYVLGYEDFWREPVFFELLVTMLLVAAIGYWLNDVADWAVDTVNRPQRAAYVKFIGRFRLVLWSGFLYVVGLGIIFFSAQSFANKLLRVCAMGALVYYAFQGKRKGLPGNLLIALLSAAVPWDVVLWKKHINVPAASLVFYAAGLTFLRELVKGAQDQQGDKIQNIRTLALSLSSEDFWLVVRWVFFLIVISLPVPFWAQHILTGQWMWGYVSVILGGVVTPLAWAIFRKVSYSLLSMLLKIAMLMGMISILLLGL
ncbi:MAG: UbiA family prenyltransferase [Bacteroidia bacterium]